MIELVPHKSNSHCETGSFRKVRFFVGLLEAVHTTSGAPRSMGIVEAIDDLQVGADRLRLFYYPDNMRGACRFWKNANQRNYPVESGKRLPHSGQTPVVLPARL